jgi:hypothetical protein
MGGAAGVGGAGGTTTNGGASSCAHETATGVCFPTDKACGIVGSSCMARVENCAEATPTFRVSQLEVSAPEKLATTIVELTIIQDGINQNLPQCYFDSGSKGSFNWLMQLQPGAMAGTGTLRTGAAPTVADPDGGYCFLSKMYAGAAALPTSAPYTTDASTGELATSAPISELVLAIFVDASAPPDMDPILLPLSQASLSHVVVSDNGNCIGKFKGDTLSPESMCLAEGTDPKSDTTYQWQNGGQVDAYIKLQDADAVPIVTLGGASLCTLLTGMTDPNDHLHCPHDAAGHVQVQGDTSSIENPGSLDSMTFSARFAASAVTIGNAGSDGSCL